MSRLVIICVIGLMACINLSAPASPSIEFEKKVLNFSDIRAGQEVKAAFQFKNVGDEELQIKSLHASCGCTKVKALSDKLQPGESSSIEVAYTAPAISVSGVIPKSIQVNTNDPINPTVPYAAETYICGHRQLGRYHRSRS